VSIPEEDQKSSSLTDEQAQMIAKLLIDLEERNGQPQDFEWAFENGNWLRCVCVCVCFSLTVYCTGQLYCLQARPIVTLPLSSFFVPDVRGSKAVLWDNSNIVESYSGVTSPLTFSFASKAYEQVLMLAETILVPRDSARVCVYERTLCLLFVCKRHPCVPLSKVKAILQSLLLEKNHPLYPLMCEMGHIH